MNKVFRDEYNVRTFQLLGGVAVSEGGWIGRKWMTSKELNDTRDRWVKSSYKTGELQPDYDGWIHHQCGGCRYFGALGADYGICCNAQSVNDGKVVFEHGGCNVNSVLIEGSK